MRQLFIKDGIISSFEVIEDKIGTTIFIDDMWVSNPTLEDFYRAGWEDYIEPEPYIPSYAELVEQYIREHGYETYGAEIAIINNYAMDPSTYSDAYASYIQTRIDAKEWANEQKYRD